jgi:hypothetical protein
MADVFLSYAHDDDAIMRRVRGDLRAEGFDVWTDETGLKPGTPDWENEIMAAIEGAGCLVVLLSPDAKQSEWVGLEISYARATDKTIVPLLVRGDEGDAIPISLIKYQRVDVGKDYPSALKMLAGTVGELLGWPGYTGMQSDEGPVATMPDPAVRAVKVAEVAEALAQVKRPHRRRVNVGRVQVVPNLSGKAGGEIIAKMGVVTGPQGDRLAALGWTRGHPPSWHSGFPMPGGMNASPYWRGWPGGAALTGIAENVVAVNEALTAGDFDPTTLEVTTQHMDAADM